MLIDDITIRVKAGNGGDGRSAFNKNLMSLGPVGGSGGDGGNVYLEAVNDIGALRQFRNKKNFAAQDGGEGQGQFVDGKDGSDLLLKIPAGSVVHYLDTGKSVELLNAGDKILAAKGGKGGKGNFHFRSATNTSPRQFQKGTLGEAFDLRLELKLIADFGLIGLPNVGKSSLLNELTNAKSKVANYQFTTLEPNLGSFHGKIIADIPGLIENASSGKGLGIKFLRHIERTKVLLHCIAADSENVAVDYDIVKKEMELYNPVLVGKLEYVLLTKSDTVSENILRKKVESLRSKNDKVMPVSIYDIDKQVSLKKLLSKLCA